MIANNFIVVDDDPINNMICRKILQQFFPEADVQVFTDPEVALDFIQSTYARADISDAVIFLDINMPTLSGWEFLDVYEALDTIVKGHLKIYMLSSSIDPRDKERADDNKNVSGYIEKPLDKAKVETLLSK